MKLKILGLLLCFCSSALAQKQNTFSAGSTCGVALVHQTVAIDDDGHHSISLDQRECRFQNAAALNGFSILKYVSSGVDDVQFDKSVDRGYAVGETAGGDKYFIRYEGTATLKNGVPEHLEGTCTFTGGTGSLRGLSGRGTYSAHPTTSGGMVFQLEGKYLVAPAAEIVAAESNAPSLLTAR